jgi:hypothetical protein
VHAYIFLHKQDILLFTPMMEKHKTRLRNTAWTRVENMEPLKAVLEGR